MEGTAFTWEIRDFSKLTDRVLHSDPFSIGGYKWRMDLYPKGVNKDNTYLSVFFAVADAESLPPGWSRAAKFMVELINLADKAQSVKLVTSTQCKFHAGLSALGWPKLIDIKKLHRTKGFVVKDTIMVKADIVQDQKGEELRQVVEKKSQQPEVKVEQDKDSKESDVLEKMEEVGGEQEEGEADVDEDNALDKCLSNEAEKIKKYRLIWLRKAKRRKLDKANGTEAKSLSSVHHIRFQESCKTSLVEVDGLAEDKSNCPAESQTPLQTYAALFDDISRVVGPSSSSLVSLREADAGTETVNASLSFSLLKHVAKKSFCQISSHLWPELASALMVLSQAKSLPSAQVCAISSFSNQFENLCRSYDSNIALLDTAQQFLDKKDGTLVSLNRVSKSQSEIRGSLDSIEKEKVELWSRLTELFDLETQLLEDYSNMGNKATRVKAEWDGVVANDAEMTRLRGEAENGKAAIETSWAKFISHFK